MKVVSLFDGISVAREALRKANLPVESYKASEIDPYAIKISKTRWPTIQHIGDVRDCSGLEMDLLIGGSPCQDLSIAKVNREGLMGQRSRLFWEFVRIRNESKPRWWILENVASMSMLTRNQMTEALGCVPILIDASLVSAQSRKRLFWTNIPTVLPTEKGIKIKDILEKGVDSKYTVATSYCKAEGTGRKVGTLNGNNAQANRIYSIEGKSPTLSANGGGLGAKTGLYVVGEVVRRLTPIECERLQGLPDGYTEGVSDTQRYKTLGNAFNADVITHILKGIRMEGL